MSEDTSYSDFVKNLDDDKVKLVVYTVVSLKPGAEEVMPNGSGSIIVTERMTPATFTAWIIALYFQSPDNRKLVPHEEKQYLRVSYAVSERWDKVCFNFEEEQVKALRKIRDALAESDAQAR